MITFQQAIAASRPAAEQMFAAGKSDVEETEVESYHDREAWAITLSMVRESAFDQTSLHLSGSPKYYKRFFVDRETGEVLGARIRELNVA